MNKDFLKYIKIVNGIFLTATLIWMIFWFVSIEYLNIREVTIISIFVLSVQIIIFLFSSVFYLFTKKYIAVHDQIKYGLVTLIGTIDLLFLINATTTDGTAYIFLFLINSLSILYILKINFNKKAQKES
ncbi:hypothetical protein SAMN05216297_11931 [Flavobacterium phragmitis]|uniref:Uncharacterized protein n=1 Tax=Flavobacterium phragmitis TaxID=739143 RepID=A0A1I1XDB3_9FLAO|nr:hypothetical protein SAMN05216297_11931 [Flavobacterium phragmitis]